MTKKNITSHYEVSEAMRTGIDFEDFEKAFGRHIEDNLEEFGRKGINIPNGIGWTLLHTAAMNKDPRYAEFLLKYNPDKTLVDMHGDTAGNIAARYENSETYKKITGEELTQEVKEECKASFANYYSNVKAMQAGQPLQR